MLQQPVMKGNRAQTGRPGVYLSYSPFSLAPLALSASGCGMAMTL